MTHDEFQERKRQLIDQERHNPPGWFFISFAAPGVFLGCVIVQGQGPTTAIDRAHRLGINPGGEALVARILDQNVAGVPLEARDRLLSRENAERLLGKMERVTGGRDQPRR